MKTPVLLLGASVIFWGWQTGLWIFALPIALILEASHFIDWRWDFSAYDVRRITDLCIIVFFLSFVYILLENRSIYFIYHLLQWLPCIFFPLIVAQSYSINDHIDIHNQFFILKKVHNEHNFKSVTVNLNYFYLAICILSSSCANNRDNYFYFGMFLITSVALWFVRSKRFPFINWFILILLAGNIGFIGHLGLHQLHLTVEERVVEWLANTSGQYIDPLNKQTNIGEIGLLKMSNDILFRVASRAQLTSPLLLREATYNKYQSSDWLASSPDFTSIQPESNGTTWHLANKPAHSSTVSISTRLNNGKGLLKLADGTFQIDELPVNSMERNKYGTVKVEGNFDAIAYQIHFEPSLSLDKPPTENDLQIPKQEKPALNQVISQIDILGKSPEQILPRVETFFQKNFSYSLKLAGKGEYSTPISKFLLKTRSGHCEYFATATTLLLRAVGIPARYAVGYSVHEFSPLENQYVVRSRHAHAWTLAYVGGKWQVIDTTPADWTTLEDATAPKWALISDLWSFLIFKISACFRYIRHSNLFKHVWWLLFLLIFIVMRILNREKLLLHRSKKRTLSKTLATNVANKTPSEFYIIEKVLNELGLSRQPSESLKKWIERLKQELHTSDLIEELTSIIELYYRHRFDPQGIEESETARLKSSVKSWLDKYHQRRI
ncbi:transglutaminase domain-containing protein [Aetokthonos hydrillicola Thurmond2011]|jgi:hypothetical protein|uniref:Transglutaminase domain-containing protein n=1 Tax=Aetokthonos hydrillicola Thurmond2011 TaxID=2712845 RepID=A0AAP5M9G7_9CYAN|nr:transglutaminase domain-containing protein [Aetokthonos hydrillicola]MBO3461802.1 transglutaminase domain-containing protein [Aetokthonos hydrillicola CCALA 1050]MBW4589946.1 transglutaminase domain-containing protein [Aetokthonos hydrillicola CCALA 1050]MDR9895727.1 transglutaminase domain-containing protein [Aetokthonos hydrillicola Thurmond2011]